MAFEKNSRYAKLESYEVTDRRGRAVKVVPVPANPEEVPRGRHLLRQGQRLDHLAFKYLEDPEAFWRIAEVNDAMLPESLSEQQEIIIPKKRK